MERAIFAGGCFWCTEAYFLILEGVVEVNPGYIGGHIDHPTYEMICTGNTGHVEAIEITYDHKKISYINNFNNKYNFLDNSKIDCYHVYYDILNNCEEYKLKNIYNFIYKRVKYINYDNNLPELNIEDTMTSQKLNKYLEEYINNDIVKCIIIMNSIQQYYYPNK